MTLGIDFVRHSKETGRNRQVVYIIGIYDVHLLFRVYGFFCLSRKKLDGEF